MEECRGDKKWLNLDFEDNYLYFSENGFHLKELDQENNF